MRSLRALPDGGTEVAGISEITITGLLAQFGSRVVEEVSNQMFTEFTSSLQQSLQATGTRAGAGEKAKPLRAVPLVLAAVRNMIQKSFASSIMQDRTAGDGMLVVWTILSSGSRVKLSINAQSFGGMLSPSDWD